MARNKPIPRSQRPGVKAYNRGAETSRSSPNAKDTVKNISVGIMDMDSAIMYYFNEVIQPTVTENKETVKVPCLYASPERWVSIQKQGFLRDKKRQAIVPLIVFKRTGIEKNENIPVDKLDANNPNHFYTFEQKYSQQQRYDRFSVQQGLFHNKELHNVVIPDYVTLSYEFTIWTSYIEQMNRIVEKINYSDGAYWGEPGKMRFRTTIENFADATEMDTERLIKTTFSVQMYGYIIPESFNKYITTKKYLTPKQIILKDDVDVQLASLIKPEEGVQSITVSQANKVSSAKTTLTNALTLTGGTGVTMTGVTNFTGESAALGTISIGQDVGTTSNVVFNDVSASSAIHVGDTSFTISQRADGTAQVDKDWHVKGDIFAENYIVSSSVMHYTQSFANGDNVFGDTLTDNQRFTGSVDVTGSLFVNGVQVSTGGSGDFTNGSATKISGSSTSTGSFSVLELNSDATIDGDVIATSGSFQNLEVTQYIKHKGDTNTLINFTDNRIRLQAGGIPMIGIHKDGDAPYPVTVNNGGNRVNFKVNDRNTDLLLKTDSEAFNVGLYYAGNKKLETKTSGIDVFGDIEATGNVIAKNYIVSSSVTHMTQSFSSGSTIFGDTLTDTHKFTGSLDVSGSLTLNGSEVGTSVSTFDTYIRKSFVKKANSISSDTASFSAVTASAPSGLTATSENDFIFFINGQYMEHDALSVFQKNGSTFELHVNTSSIGYSLESDDEIIAQGKFNS